MMRHTDGSLRYTINGEDQGIACENIPSNVYAVIDAEDIFPELRRYLPHHDIQWCVDWFASYVMESFISKFTIPYSKISALGDRAVFDHRLQMCKQ